MSTRWIHNEERGTIIRISSQYVEEAPIKTASLHMGAFFEAIPKVAAHAF